MQLTISTSMVPSQCLLPFHQTQQGIALGQTVVAPIDRSIT